MKRRLDFGNLLSTKVFLDPADHCFFGQLRERDQVIGALKSKAAVGATGIGAVVSVDGVVGGEYKTVCGFALQVGNRPGIRGVSHWNGGDGRSLGVVGKVVKVTCGAGRTIRKLQKVRPFC